MEVEKLHGALPSNAELIIGDVAATSSSMRSATGLTGNCWRLARLLNASESAV
jgi:hypothetical protein